MFEYKSDLVGSLAIKLLLVIPVDLGGKGREDLSPLLPFMKVGGWEVAHCRV